MNERTTPPSRLTRARAASLRGVLLALVSALLPGSVAYGQVDVEAMAKLYFTIESQRGSWFEGFDAARSGSLAPYGSYRNPERRDSAFVVRTSSEESLIEWATAPVPRSWRGDSAKFLWVCGFGNNLGNEEFDLDVNGAMHLSFATPGAGAWSVSGTRGTRLSFVAAAVNSNGANLGIMALTIPRDAVTPGAPVTVRVRSRKGATEVWYRAYAYRDALRFFEREHATGLFSRTELRYLGDATVTFCGPKRAAGSVARVLSSGKTVGAGELRADGIIAKASVVIPRHLQPPAGELSILRVGKTTVDTLRWERINRERLRAFFDEQLECERYVFPPGELPSIGWKRPAMVDNEMGTFPLKVSYYDARMRPATRADAPGRYGAVVEGLLPSGFTLKRYITLYCAPVSFDDYSESIPVAFRRLAGYGISDAQWRLYEKSEERFAFGSMKMLPLHDPDAAVFLAGLSELDSAARPGDTPRLRDRQWWISFKQSLSGNDRASIALRKSNAAASPLLDEHPRTTDPFTPEQLDRVRAVCREWALRSGTPHVTLIASRGRIVFHEAFNSEGSATPVGVDSALWMASITKLLTGTLMMEFVDRGLVDLDAPVSRYLPELPSGTMPELTVRRLFNHTTGLHDLGDGWASDWNPALENYVAQAIPSTKVGQVFSYHRVGYAIAGKVLERLTGRAVPALFQEYLFDPLGMTSAFADNTYGGLSCTALDLARFAEMLLRRGSYGGTEFFSQESYRRMLPEKIDGIDRTWGIGTSPMEEPGLGRGAFGHHAASGGVLRIDPVNDLVIISARNRVAGNQEEFERRLVEACTAPFRP